MMKIYKSVLLLPLFLLAASFFNPTFAQQISNNAEFFLYDDQPGNDGRTDFYAGGADDWGVESRVDYLKNYAEFMKARNGKIKLDEYVTSIDEVNEAIQNLKLRPFPKVRRETQLERWRHALSEEGETLGWTAPDFDDSGWEETKRTPLVIPGEEEQDLWIRARMQAGEFQKAFLEFDSLLGTSKIWVGGAEVKGPNAEHFHDAPFRVDVTSYLTANAENLIAVRIADHKEPSKLIGWGLMGGVRLIQTGAAVIDNVFVSTEAFSENAARLKVQFTLLNYTTSQFYGTAEATVRRWFPQEDAAPAGRADYPVELFAGSGPASPIYYALDFGSEDSPLEPGYERVTPNTAYDDARGFGWEKNKGVEATDSERVPLSQFIESDLKRDAAMGDRPAEFKLKTEPGRWAFRFVIGGPDEGPATRISYIKDTLIAMDGSKTFEPLEFGPIHLTQYIRSTAATLKIAPTEKGQRFAINGLTALNGVPDEGRFEKTLEIPSPAPWSPDSPNLYELRLTLRDANSEATDDIVTTFGVAHLEMSNGDIYLNGERLRLRGVLETHSFPPERQSGLYAVAPPDRWIVQDILDAKRGNVNALRFHPAEAMGTNYLRWLDYADQLGMFVFWSPRFWFHWGARSPNDYLPLMDPRLKPSMIAARNHPSIFAWEGGNETYFNSTIWDERARRFSDDYYQAANAVDPSRFILPISFWYAQFEGRNDFYRRDPNRGGELDYPGSGPAPLSFWADNVVWDVHPYPGWYDSWIAIWIQAGKGDYYRKDRPLLVSEFGAEGMPNWELYKDETYYHVWDNVSHPSEHEKNAIGRNLGFDEWQISQAYQALVIYNMIAMFRSEDADGGAICTGAEGRHNGKYFKGLRDMWHRPKLSWYATKDAYQPAFVQGLEGDMILSSADAINPIIVNDGPAATDAKLEIIFKTMDGKEVERKEIPNIQLQAAETLRLEPVALPATLKSGAYYQVEYVLSKNGDG